MASVGPRPQTLSGRLLRTASQVPEKILLSDTRTSITAADLLGWADGVAKAVTEATGQSRVGVLLPTDATFGPAFYGCQLAGRAVIPLSQILKPADLRWALTDSGVDTVITTGAVAALLDGWDGRRLNIEQIEPTGGVDPAAMPHDNASGDAAVVLYTAGSEAEPKGVVLTHDNLLSNLDSLVGHARLTADDVYLGILPMSHAFALLGTLVAPVCTGARVHYVDRFIPSEIGEACVQERATIMLAIPSMYNLMLRARDLAWATQNHLRLCISGGEALPSGVAERFEEVFKRPLLNGYGMTETSPVISLNLPWASKPDSVGRPIPSVEVRILDDQGNALGPNIEGEIGIRGPSVMAGYLNHPTETARRHTSDGFFRTGDLGLTDDDGFLFIIGRKKEIIIISGENVSPAEIESVLRVHPMVADAAVIGTNHETRGEAPVAFVIGRRFHKLSPKELRQHCRDHLAAFKVPRKFIISDKLPRDSMNRILKRALPDLLEDIANGNDDL